jgi:PIN domain nuclease of toxin-antitoxin system
VSAYLLDSHVFLWLLEEEARLGAGVVRTLASADRLYLSAIGVAELSIKASRGRLSLPPDLVDAMAAMRIEPLALSYEHAAMLGELPLHHKDPFDRLMIAQAMVEGLTMVTRDRAFASYEGLAVLWA